MPVTAIVMLALRATEVAGRAGAVVAVAMAGQMLMLPAAMESSREDIREAVAAFDAFAGPDAVALTVAHFVRDGFTVYSHRNARVIGLPADLPGAPPIAREAPAVMEASDRAAFMRSVGPADEAWLVLSHETRGGRDRGADLARRWLGEMDFQRVRSGAGRAVVWEKYQRAGFRP
ncbi:MAG: hypothetical protein M5R36_23760 [Deltaproteobacteria bacterium]|nr:hypothetical protein [Deltaproteobacteria bacterium]